LRERGVRPGETRNTDQALRRRRGAADWVPERFCRRWTYEYRQCRVSLSYRPGRRQHREPARSQRGDQKNGRPRGERIYHGQAGGTMCAACHGSAGTGTSSATHLTKSKWLCSDGSYSGIRATIVNGVPQPQKYRVPMPPMGGAPPERRSGFDGRGLCLGLEPPIYLIVACGDRKVALAHTTLKYGSHAPTAPREDTLPVPFCLALLAPYPAKALAGDIQADSLELFTVPLRCHIFHVTPKHES